MAESTEQTFFQWFTVIMALYVLVIAVVNVFQFNKLATGNSGALTREEASVMFWLNVIIIVAVAIFFLWGLIKLIGESRRKGEITETLRRTQKTTGLGVGPAGAPYGYNVDPGSAVAGYSG